MKKEFRLDAHNAVCIVFHIHRCSFDGKPPFPCPQCIFFFLYYQVYSMPGMLGHARQLAQLESHQTHLIHSIHHCIYFDRYNLQYMVIHIRSTKLEPQYNKIEDQVKIKKTKQSCRHYYRLFNFFFFQLFFFNHNSRIIVHYVYKKYSHILFFTKIP